MPHALIRACTHMVYKQETIYMVDWNSVMAFLQGFSPRKALQHPRSTVRPRVLCDRQSNASRAKEAENLRHQEELQVEAVETRNGGEEEEEETEAAISGKSGARHWMCWRLSACADDLCSRNPRLGW
jgi:hypothetical protein